MQIPGYFINLDRATARRSYMEGEIVRLGLPVSRVSAVDGTQITESSYAQLHPRARMHRLAKAELACFLSHRACWHLIAMSSFSYGAVFEDDIAFAEDAKRFLTQDDWLEVGTDLVKIETTSRRVMLSRQQRNVFGRSLAKLSSRHLGGGGYILSRATAQRLLEASRTIDLPLDYALFDPDMALLPDVPVLQLTPAICIQQLRSRTVFLPDGIDWSELSKDRRSLKLHGLPKLRRELTAPFIKLFRFLTQNANAAMTGRRWTMVPFRK